MANMMNLLSVGAAYGLLVLVFVAIMVFESDYTHLTRMIFFVTGT